MFLVFHSYSLKRLNTTQQGHRAYEIEGVITSKQVASIVESQDRYGQRSLFVSLSHRLQSPSSGAVSPLRRWELKHNDLPSSLLHTRCPFNKLLCGTRYECLRWLVGLLTFVSVDSLTSQWFILTLNVYSSGTYVLILLLAIVFIINGEKPCCSGVCASPSARALTNR